MESAVPRKIIYACGRFEENDWRAIRRWFLTRNFPRNRCDLKIIEPADKSALEALGEKFIQGIHYQSLFSS